MAEECQYGFGDHIQDYDEALKLYQDAARLGSPLAYEKIGDIFNFGKGTRQDLGKAVRYYKEGARKGNYFCWAAMALLFAYNDQMDNCVKCFARYFRERSENFSEDMEEDLNKHVFNILQYITIFLDHDLRPDFETHVSADADAVEKCARKMHADADGTVLEKDRLRPIIEWIVEHRQSELLDFGDKRRPSIAAPILQTGERLACPVAPSKRWWRR
jgi:TPR repeat protein